MYPAKLGEILAVSARNYPEKTAIIFGEKCITYTEFNERTNRLSNALKGLGIRPGDHVAALFYNCPEFLETLFAVVKLGGVFVPLNFRLSTSELVTLLNHSDSCALIFGPEFNERVSSLVPKLEKVRTLISAGEGHISNWKGYKNLVCSGSPHEPETRLKINHGCNLLYTAGTTGAPKGVYQTHHNLCWSTMLSATEKRINYNTVYLGSPLFFMQQVWELY